MSQRIYDFISIYLIKILVVAIWYGRFFCYLNLFCCFKIALSQFFISIRYGTFELQKSIHYYFM